MFQGNHGQIINASSHFEQLFNGTKIFDYGIRFLQTLDVSFLCYCFILVSDEN